LAGYTPWPALILSYGTIGSAWRLALKNLERIERKTICSINFVLDQK